MVKMEAILTLSDGSQFIGKSFGYESPVSGEVVFNTAMTGYPESLTDPSYAGQILTFTYPLIGNYGVPDTASGDDKLPLFMESDRIHAKAIIVSDYSENYSHWNAKESLSEWLKREHIPGITGIDTRRLTMLLREHGVMTGKITLSPTQQSSQSLSDSDSSVEEVAYDSVNWVEIVSCKDVITYKPKDAQYGVRWSVPCKWSW